jgi:glucokinase
VTLAIGVDVGGTKVLGGVVDEAGKVIAEIRRPTPSQDPDQTADVIVDVILELCADHEAVAIGVGAAGFIDEERSTVRFAPNLAWRDEPLRERVADRVPLPVFIENDANAAGWAEWRFGAGRGHEDLVLVTVGTGIGGAIVLDGALHRGRFGGAGEPGHMIVEHGGIRCGCGNQGCWEQYSSGGALTREARERAKASPRTAARLLELAEGDPAAITGPFVTQAAEEGDPLALELFAEIALWLGMGLANLSALLDPGLFILGGGVSQAGHLLLEPVQEAYGAQLTGRGHRPLAQVVLAEMGNEAGLVGAADLARRGAE